jgi:SAM-dependent methyltransferase
MFSRGAQITNQWRRISNVFGLFFDLEWGMKEIANQHATYALGHSQKELERLSRQAEVFAPFTRHLLREAGIRPGMRVLDVGCGSGDVAFLAAELVGPEGEVVGADRASAAVQWARARAEGRPAGNVRFVEGDPSEIQFEQPFDAVIGRLVLMYYPDPINAVRKLARHVRNGGLLVFQEFDVGNCRSLPAASAYDRHISLIKQTLNATGARTQMGLEMYSVFLAAGLPGPSMRLDAVIGGGPDCPVYELVSEVVRSLLPVMDELKIADATEIDISSLAQRMRDEVVANNGVVVGPGLIGSWSQKPV